MKDLKTELKISSAFFFVSVIIILLLPDIFLPSKLIMEVKEPVHDTFQIFYDTGNGYNETESETKTIIKEQDTARIRFRLPGKKINKIRIDPGTKAGTTVIENICFESLLNKHCMTALDAHKAFKPLHDVTAFAVKDNLLYVESSGVDPYIELASYSSNYQYKVIKTYLYIILLLISAILFIILSLGKIISDFIDYSKLSDLSRWFRYLVQYRYLIALILFSILVIGKFHGSSIAVWDSYIKETMDTDTKTLTIGKARGIRSDEWLVQTPIYFSQVVSKPFFPMVNTNIRSEGQNMLLSYYAPVFDITLIGKPFNWGFILLGKEYGLSWYWYSKFFLLLLLSFEISMFLTNKDTFVSTLGAFWITYSPAVQWWYSTAIIDILIFSQAIIVSVWHYTNNANKIMKLFLVGVLTSGIIGFILTIYPTYQVPFGYLVLIFVFFIIYYSRSNIQLKKYDFILLTFSALIISLSLYSFVIQSYEALKIMHETVYPGKRFATGGSYDINFLQFYLSNWLSPYKGVDFLNNCEVSTFLSFLPALLLIFVAVYQLEDSRKGFVLALFGYLIFQLSWLMVSYPVWFAKYSLFSWVPEFRLQIVTNLTAAYLGIWMFSLLLRYRPLKLNLAFLITCCIMIIYYFSIRHTPMFDYLGPLNAYITILFFFMLNISFLSGRKKLFGSFLMIYVLVAGLTVNPISRGIGSIYNKTISQKVLEIKEREPEQKWMALNSLVNGNFLVALGVKTFNSVHYYPDLKMWRTLDPIGKYADVYNRYAHVEVQLTAEKTYFKMKQPDNFVLYLNIEDLNKTDVKYILSFGKIESRNYPALKEVAKVESDNLFIYEVTS